MNPANSNLNTKESGGKIKELISQLTKSLLKLQTASGSFKDPVYKFEDPRVAAELAKSLAYLGKKEESKKAFNWLIKTQNKNHSWNEVLPDKNNESCLATAIIGRFLLIGYKKTKDKKYKKSALNAAKFVLSKEFSPGYFIKSNSHYADVLNVNASCAAFLYELYKTTKDKKYIKARDRAIFNTVRYQFNDGAYPYGSQVRCYSDFWNLNDRDPHYQAITLYHLLKSDPQLKNQYLKISAPKAMKWLDRTITKKGADWSKDKLMFSIGTTGIYGYAAYCFNHFKMHGKQEICINILKKRLTNGLYERYEPPNIIETIKGVSDELFELNYNNPSQHSLPEKYKRIRNRLKRDLIERRKRQPSLYYSAQILECLTEIKG